MKKLLVGLFALTAMNGAASARMESVIIPETWCQISIYGLKATGSCTINTVEPDTYMVFRRGQAIYRINKYEQNPEQAALYKHTPGEEDIYISLVENVEAEDESCWAGRSVSVCYLKK